MKSVIIAAASFVAVASAADDSSHASAVWIGESQTISRGEPLRTVIKMRVDEGWHTYWSNPGEGGLPLSIKAELPEGWTLGEIQYPAPIRFMTGELPGFGYEGEILFPLVIHPPADTEGEVPEFSASLSWLTCNDETCLPGKAELALPGEVDSKLVAKAFTALPQPLEGAKLSVTERDEKILFELSIPSDTGFSPVDHEVFPLTRNVIDPASKPSFEKNTRGIWKASAPKSEYFSGKLDQIVLILKSPNQGAFQIESK
ncbi:protein-disulfide reductase DsbD domain-containing protein [Luteolibacter algae]|uniref:Protein-disulfide reductase DsbD domain-containing protein n=1 Tax=Luteolibacter algae TaxID=454151 RepID=A0ABW5D7W1_9BACT